MKYRLALIICMTCVAPNLAGAKNDQMGVGLQSCETFAKQFKANPLGTESAFIIWASGYMSGANAALGQMNNPTTDLSVMTVEEQKQFMREYCQQNLLASYATGVVLLMLKLQSRGAKEAR